MARVYLDIMVNGKFYKQLTYNYIDKNGKIISDEWFYNVYSFYDGLAKVQRGNGLWNFIDANGKIISDEWFIYVDMFNDGLAKVKRTNGEWAKIDKNGKIIKN